MRKIDHVTNRKYLRMARNTQVFCDQHATLPIGFGPIASPTAKLHFQRPKSTVRVRINSFSKLNPFGSDAEHFGSDLYFDIHLLELFFRADIESCGSNPGKTLRRRIQ